MDIPNLSTNQVSAPQKTQLFSVMGLSLVLLLALASGFWASRLFPFSKSSNKLILPGQQQAISTDNISNASQIQVGKLYGDTGTAFKDSATGTVEKGSINGIGTHILNRDGGASQRVSLTSSVVDLDLFVGHKVEVKGETNATNKTGWLLDVGSVKVLE